MRLRALVVEDDLLSLRMIGEVLASADIEALGFNDTWEAAALIEKDRFDGVFLDLNMPGIDGFELIKRIRKSIPNATTPIIVVSGGATPNSLKQAFAAGAQFYLSKPVDAKKLRQLLKTTYGSLLREQRRSRRVTLCVEASCRAESGVFNATISSIGEQSLSLKGAGKPRTGESIQLGFRLPNSPQFLQVVAVVGQVDDGNIADCRFTKVDEGTRRAIEVFLAAAGHHDD